MRKVGVLGFSLVSLLIFLLIFIFSFVKESSAENSKIQEEANYELPYPGLLPDNPLYFLRATRDRVVSFLISDPTKKAEFNLLQADKRLNAGIYLFNKGKIDLSISTISKAENYFEEAIGNIEQARREGADNGTLKEKMKVSAAKHKEVLQSLIGKSNKDFKGSFEREAKRIGDFEERLER